MTGEPTLRAMARDELDVLVDWAAAEGWNPGLSDAALFWDTDPDGFVAAELGGKMIGGGSIVAYGGRFGFMGFFIVHPDHRGRGIGRTLWHHRRDLLRARLEAGAPIGMDGVLAMRSFYGRGGFRDAGHDVRMEGVGAACDPIEGVVDAREVALSALADYDARHFPAPRPAFVGRWIAQPGARAMAALEDGCVRGYGVVRPCRTGAKIGPLFADDERIADTLLRTLADHVPGQPLFLDVPEANPRARALADRHGMREVFACARMYLGVPPRIHDGGVFGVTTFELG